MLLEYPRGENVNKIDSGENFSVFYGKLQIKVSSLFIVTSGQLIKQFVFSVHSIHNYAGFRIFNKQIIYWGSSPSVLVGLLYIAFLLSCR